MASADIGPPSASPVCVWHVQRNAPHRFSIERCFSTIRQALDEPQAHRLLQTQHSVEGTLARMGNFIGALRWRKLPGIFHVTGDIQFLAALLPRDRTILTVLDCVHLRRLRGSKQWLFWLFWYWLPCRMVSRITVISEATKQELMRWVPSCASKIKVIPVPLPTGYIHVPKAFPITRWKVLQVGCGENKNFQRVVRALAGLDCHLTVVGNLSTQQNLILASSDIQADVRHDLSDSEMIRVYQDADLLVFASTAEGFGVPIIEAQATGRPVVTSNLEPMRSVAGESGACLVDPYSIPTIRAGIIKVATDENYRNSLIECGLANSARFAAKIVAEQYRELYRELGA